MKVIELFAGVGSQTQALKNIGIDHEVVAICEFDKYADKSYRCLHGDVNNLGDITKVEKLPSADLWTYSFPCQSVSVSGKMEGLSKGGGTCSGLLWEVERLLNYSEKPRYLLMENVKNLVSKKFMPDFQLWCDFLESLGYTNYWQVLNAKDYGIPQNRERVFMVSILGEHKPYVFPEKQELKLRLLDMCDSEVEEKYYLSKDAIDYMSRYRDGKPRWEFHKNDINGLAATIPAVIYKGVPYGVITLDSHIRKLTPLECWRLMGWKDEQFDKIDGVSNSQLYKQAGNGIVVDVLEAIFKQLFAK